MGAFRDKPILAIALLVLAVLVLGASLYFTFGRTSVSSPFEQQPQQPAPQPSDSKEGAPTVVM
ncbi:MAG: hypothetical protein NZ874_07870 [Fimbriimonadales bacterium]|nr:hypothetical protein [Fimbriimonadales bacterium]